MRKYVIVLLASVLAIGIAASFAKGAATNAERQRIQQQCDIDPNCTYYHIEK